MNVSSEQRRVLTVAEAAEQLGIGMTLMWGLIKAREIPVVRMGKTAVRIRLSDVNRFLEERAEASCAQR